MIFLYINHNTVTIRFLSVFCLDHMFTIYGNDLVEHYMGLHV